jgi:hypothetical protein
VSVVVEVEVEVFVGVVVEIEVFEVGVVVVVVFTVGFVAVEVFVVEVMVVVVLVVVESSGGEVLLNIEVVETETAELILVELFDVEWDGENVVSNIA